MLTRTSLYMDILDHFDFYFVPLLNPDGYKHSFEVDRLWRKSRSDTGSYLGCLGVDLNRNCGTSSILKYLKFNLSLKFLIFLQILNLVFSDYKWNTCSGCSSGNPCSQLYRGESAFTESEVNFLRRFVKENAAINWKYYISFHCFSQVSLKYSFVYIKFIHNPQNLFFKRFFQMFLTPWGFTNDIPENYKQQVPFY